MNLLIAMLLAAQPGAAPSAVGRPMPGPAPRAVSPSGAFDARLLALEVAVSRVVTTPIDAWRFDALRAEADRLVDSAPSNEMRDAASDARRRIDRFDAIAQRSRTQRVEREPQREPQREPASALATRTAPPVRLTKTAEGRHDVEGVLRPVVSKRPNAPRYGVVDDDGRLAALVTPTPQNESRLEALIGRRVGLDGRRGYRTDLRQQHVVAERVTALPTTVR